jgi:transposase
MITDQQWQKLEPLLEAQNAVVMDVGNPGPTIGPASQGVWVLRTGARWRDLPQQYSSGSTCWRRLQDGKSEGRGPAALGRTFLAVLPQQKKGLGHEKN